MLKNSRPTKIDFGFSVNRINVIIPNEMTQQTQLLMKPSNKTSNKIKLKKLQIILLTDKVSLYNETFEYANGYSFCV